MEGPGALGAGNVSFLQLGVGDTGVLFVAIHWAIHLDLCPFPMFYFR